jgi:hypothetical protein
MMNTKSGDALSGLANGKGSTKTHKPNKTESPTCAYPIPPLGAKKHDRSVGELVEPSVGAEEPGENAVTSPITSCTNTTGMMVEVTTRRWPDIA